MFEIIFSIIIFLYFAQTLFFVLGAIKKFPRLEDNELSSVTILVAARNEEDNILRCLESLNEVVYPDNKLEIIIIDGHSTDKTAHIVKDYVQDKPKFKCISAAAESSDLKGKALALDTGIRIAKGEIILQTDADCAVPPEWAKTMASHYTEDVAMVLGYTTQKIYGKPFFAMQALDFIYLLTLAGGSANRNMHLSCIGNNMSYKKSVYDELGGYRAINFSVTEDLKLLIETKKLGKYKIIFPMDEKALVVSEPCKDASELYHQKKRWTVGGLQSPPKGFVVVSLGYLSNIGVLLAPFFFSIWGAGLLFAKIGIDLLMLYPTLKKLKLLDKLKYFLAFELYFLFYVTLIPFVLILDRKVIWKDKVYNEESEDSHKQSSIIESTQKS